MHGIRLSRFTNLFFHQLQRNLEQPALYVSPVQCLVYLIVVTKLGVKFNESSNRIFIKLRGNKRKLIKVNQKARVVILLANAQNCHVFIE